MATRQGFVGAVGDNREDDAIRALAATALRFQPDRVVLRELEDFPRWCEPG